MSKRVREGATELMYETARKSKTFLAISIHNSLYISRCFRRGNMAADLFNPDAEAAAGELERLLNSEPGGPTAALLRIVLDEFERRGRALELVGRMRAAQRAYFRT